MSKDNNTPPFQIGEEVVCLKSCDYPINLKSGQIVTVGDIRQCKCGVWMVGVANTNAPLDHLNHKGHVLYHTGIFCYYGEAQYFRRINPYTNSVSAELANEAMKERVEVGNPVKEIEEELNTKNKQQ